MLIIKFLATAAFLGSIAWMVAAPDYEPALAIFTSLSALIASFVIEKRRKSNATQQQEVSGNGLGIQAGGDVSVGNVSRAVGKKTDA